MKTLAFPVWLQALLYRSAALFVVVLVAWGVSAPTLDRDKINPGEVVSGDRQNGNGKQNGKKNGKQKNKGGRHGGGHYYSGGTTIGVGINLNKLLGGNRPQTLPFGVLTSRPGFVLSPYAPGKRALDVRKIAPGTVLTDPHTGSPFIVPAPGIR